MIIHTPHHFDMPLLLPAPPIWTVSFVLKGSIPIYLQLPFPHLVFNSLATPTYLLIQSSILSSDSLFVIKLLQLAQLLYPDSCNTFLVPLKTTLLLPSPLVSIQSNHHIQHLALHLLSHLQVWELPFSSFQFHPVIH